MAKFLGATSLVVLALLGCQVGTEVEAQGLWMATNIKTPVQHPVTSQDPLQNLKPPPQGNPSFQYTKPPENNQRYFESVRYISPSYQTANLRPPQAMSPPGPPNSNPSSSHQGNPTTYQHPKPPSYPQSSLSSSHYSNLPSHSWNNPYPPQTPPENAKGFQVPAYDQAPQSPQTAKHPQPATPKLHVLPPKLPQYPAPLNCAVDLSVRIGCGPPTTNATECEALNCCFGSTGCYFGKAVTVACTKDAKFIVVVAKDATLPNIDLEAISLLGGGQGCTHVDSNSQFTVYEFPVTACGSLAMEEPGAIVYQNRLTSTYEVEAGPRGDITRDSHFEVLFQCRYIGTSVEALVVEVFQLNNPPLPVAGQGPISVQLRLANGQCSTKGCNEVDVAYTSFYTQADYPVSKVLRDPVYVDVQLLGKTDPLLVLILGRCWATTSPEPHSLPQWDILIGGCPCKTDRYLSTLVPVEQSPVLEFPNHHKRFIFKMFTFVNPSTNEPLSEQVFIHCSTDLCYADPATRCQRVCHYRRRRDIASVSQEKSEPKVVVSSGPVIMVSPQQ